MAKSFRAICLVLPFAAFAPAQYVGSKVCNGCHADKFQSQSKTGHAHALALAAKDSPGQWAFGAGEKATTWITQRDEDTIVEHGVSYYAATKSMGLTPGHKDASDAAYRIFDPVGTALRCFRCHSTGPVNLLAGYRIQPSEPGVRCEACHGRGSQHVRRGGGRGSILNPGRLRAADLNEMCGACHRQGSELDDETDWTNAWNVRHQPAYLHRAACFRNSRGALSCLTCHDPHQPLRHPAAFYDARCSGCHRSVAHRIPVASHSCVECHMPQVVISPALRFTNHWIGIYEGDDKLVPSRRAVTTLSAASQPALSTQRRIALSDPSTLALVYEKALLAREREFGPMNARVARSASELGLFLIETGDPRRAEAPLRRALEIDQANRDPMIDFDRESLAAALDATGKQREALDLLGAAAGGKDPKLRARCLARMARLDPSHADSYLRDAVRAEENASGKDDRRVAVLLHELALTLRERDDDDAAEPVLRRALDIQEKIQKPDSHLTVAIMNTLGNLLEGAHQMDDAERLERAALRLAQTKFGPESPELSMTCTSLADVLWNKRDLAGAEQNYRRALAIDTALYGPERPETAADIANLGMLLNEKGEAKAAELLLRQALAIYEKSSGRDSAQANFVRQNLSTLPTQ